jgi:MarR family transcriptional regulator, organic hydroperoxide resistance regulator
VKRIPDALKAQVDRIAEAIIYLYTESRRLTKEAAARVGLTGPQLSVVKMLDELGDMSLSALSDKIRAQNSTVTGIVDRMEREGLVDRKRSVDDRRVVHIRLTEKGARLARSLTFEPFEIFRHALENALTQQELLQLLTLLDKLATYVKEEAATEVDERDQRSAGK